MKTNLKFKAGWLRAFFDGEGTVCFCQRTYKTKTENKKSRNYFLAASNTDIDIINTCMKYLDDFGIDFILYRPKKEKDHFKQHKVIRIGRADAILKFHKIINFSSLIKRRKLEEIVRWIGNRTTNGISINHEKKSFFRSIHPSVLSKMYWEDKLSCIDIAKELELPTGSSVKIGKIITRFTGKPLRNSSERRLVASQNKRISGFGESHHKSKLTNKDVKTILGLLKTNMSCAAISRMYNVSKSTIEKIGNGKTWTHIKR